MKLQIVLFLSFLAVLTVKANETPVATPERVCEPGTSYTKDCSFCTCNAEGTEATCEKRDCPDTQKVSEPSTETVEKCTPGELYKVKCNECKCPESGLKSEASCTIIGCPDE